MFTLKLIKARSYNGKICATRANPIVEVEDEAIAEEAVATGYFTLVSADEDHSDASIDWNEMTITELEEYAEKNGIDLTGAKRKAEIIAAIEASFGPTSEPTADFTE